MDAAWSTFLFQTTPTQTQVEGSLQSELMSVHTTSSETPPPDHMAPPPSTVDTAALNEDPVPVPVKPVSRPGSGQRVAHICAICSKQFKNSYNLRRHQSVHTGVRMKDRAAREREAAAANAAAMKEEGGVEGGHVVGGMTVGTVSMGGMTLGTATTTTVPLSLLHLSTVPQVLTSAPPGGQQQQQQQMGSVMSTHVHTHPHAHPHAHAHTHAYANPGATLIVQPQDASSGGVTMATVATTTTTVSPLPPPAPANAIVMSTGDAVQQRQVNPSANPVRKNHACETCGKAFRDVYHLNRHRLSHSDEKPFSCPICQQRFKRKDRMSHHVRSHQGGVEKPYICPNCSKAFSRPDHLNSHIRQVHSSERPFKCPTCESSFATRDRLRAHMIRHEEKVPCHICGKLLSAAYITDHMRVHNQSQHHSCHLCNRSFTTLTYLRVHAQKHHGQEWKESGGTFGSVGAGGVLVCQLCGVHCKTPTQLQGHMGTHNPPLSGAPSPVVTSPPPHSVAGGVATVTLSNVVTAAPTISLGNMVTAPMVSLGNMNMVATPTAVSLSNMVTSPTAVFVSGNTVVDLLVTDCSSIAQQPHS
ncbi:vascular endothelial zinc finger 1 isoform X2 [Engraulis encrasicolus]|uniref:vascular endothelial zinc finger 1 isoform X2 n=1 Tax=Engraulis encrasicolus TaxID=184585 RepID=UPI002FD384A8